MSGELVPVEAELVPDDEVGSQRDHHLSDDTVADLKRATAKNTDLAYARWWKLALAWCEQEQRTVLPMTAQTLAEFIGHLKRSTSPKTGKPYSPASLNQAVAAIRTAHFRAGFEGQPNWASGHSADVVDALAAFAFVNRRAYDVLLISGDLATTGHRERPRPHLRRLTRALVTHLHSEP